MKSISLTFPKSLEVTSFVATAIASSFLIEKATSRAQLDVSHGTEDRYAFKVWEYLDDHSAVARYSGGCLEDAFACIDKILSPP